MKWKMVPCPERGQEIPVYGCSLCGHFDREPCLPYPHPDVGEVPEPVAAPVERIPVDGHGIPTIPVSRIDGVVDGVQGDVVVVAMLPEAGRLYKPIFVSTEDTNLGRMHYSRGFALVPRGSLVLVRTASPHRNYNRDATIRSLRTGRHYNFGQLKHFGGYYGLHSVQAAAEAEGLPFEQVLGLLMYRTTKAEWERVLLTLSLEEEHENR